MYTTRSLPRQQHQPPPPPPGQRRGSIASMSPFLLLLLVLAGVEAGMAFQCGAPVTAAAAAPAAASRRSLHAFGHRNMVMSSAKQSPDGESTHAEQQRHTRKDAVLRLGGLFLGSSMMVSCAPSSAWAAAVVSHDSSSKKGKRAASVPTRKSSEEMQFEMFKRGLDLTHAFQYEEAEWVYTELIGLFGTDHGLLNDGDKQLVAKALSNRGNCRMALDRVSEALVDYSKSLELSPGTSEYWINRGLAFEILADGLLGTRDQDAYQFYAAAMGDYDHSLVLEPENHKLYLNAGDVLTRMGRMDAALEYYRRALALYPISPATRGKVALLEVENGNVARGIYLIDTITRRNPDFAEMLLASAALDWTLGKFVEGIDTYSAAIERDPRLLDDDYVSMECKWPPTMMKMLTKLREAGTMDGIRSTAVSYFESRGSLI